MQLAARRSLIRPACSSVQLCFKSASKKSTAGSEASGKAVQGAGADETSAKKKQRAKPKSQDDVDKPSKHAQDGSEPSRKKRSTFQDVKLMTDFKSVDVEGLVASFGWSYRAGHTSVLTSCGKEPKAGKHSSKSSETEDPTLYVHRETGLARCIKCGWTGFLHERVAQDAVGKRRRLIRFDNPPLCEILGKSSERVAKPVPDDAELRSIYWRTEPLSAEHSATVQRILESLDLARINVETLRHFGARIWRTSSKQQKTDSLSDSGAQPAPAPDGNADQEVETVRIVLPLRTFVANSSKQLAKVTHFVCLDELVAYEETGERKPTLHSALESDGSQNPAAQSASADDEIPLKSMKNQLDLDTLSSSANHAIFAPVSFFEDWSAPPTSKSSTTSTNDLVVCNSLLDALVVRQDCGVDALALELNHPMSIDLLFAFERFATVTFWFRESGDAKTSSQAHADANAVMRERTSKYRFVAAFDKLTKKVGVARCRAIREKQVRAYLRTANRFPFSPSSVSSTASSLATTPDSDAFHSAVAVPSPNFGTPNQNPNEPSRQVSKEQDQLTALSNPYALFLDDRNVLAVYQACARSLIDSATQRGTSGDILTVTDLIDDVEQLFHGRNSEPDGTPWIRFPSFNRLLKGFRPGELTLISGVTGAGKTTFLSEYALDLALSGITTLFGSFEIANAKLLKTNIQQYYGFGHKANSAEHGAEDTIRNWDHPNDRGPSGHNKSPFAYQSVNLRNVDREERMRVYNAYQERVPIYFLRLFGASDVRRVYEAIARAIYQYDVQHVVIDNLQFLLGAGFVSFSEKFIRQDQTIETFRHLATAQQVHVSVVVHPRKDDADVPLSLASLFGTAKASQDADNIFIVQTEAHRTDIPESSKRKYVQLLKNRYDGEVGRFYVEFDRNTLCHRDIAHFGSSRDAQMQAQHQSFAQLNGNDANEPNFRQNRAAPNPNFGRSQNPAKFESDPLRFYN